jgi:thiol:disulfide interchange protein DsbD
VWILSWNVEGTVLGVDLGERTRALKSVSMPWRLRLVLALTLAVMLLPWAATLSFAGATRSSAPDVPASAWGESAVSAGKPRVEARLLVDRLPSDGQTLRIGVLFDLAPGWHLYWRNPGDTGLPTQLSWQTQYGRVSETRWPAPKTYDESDGLFTTYGYDERVLLIHDLSLDSLDQIDQRVALEAELLICKSQCIPAQFSLSRSLDDAILDSPASAAAARLFDTFEARVPGPPAHAGVELEAVYSRSALRPDDSFSAAIVVRSCGGGPGEVAGTTRGGTAGCIVRAPLMGSAPFVPDSDDLVELTWTGVTAKSGTENTWLVGFDGSVIDTVARDSGHRLRGVLALTSETGGETVHVTVDLPMPLAPSGSQSSDLGAHWMTPGDGTPSASTDTQAGGPGILQAILLALLGGLILNLMPCVLPVLAIKTFSVAEMAGSSRREVLSHGFAYTAGIVSSMLALAAVVLALRFAGAQVGWGFQFQSPLFVAIISIVLVAFALNLFGVFEISLSIGSLGNAGNESKGSTRSFFEGLLAVVLATPCSAPFLGTAVGFAFTGSYITIVAIFLSIGLGLAAPFMLICLMPSWSRFIPRSGPWMSNLRAGLGFALLATVVWLLWLSGARGGIDAMTAHILLLLSVSMGLWMYGLLQASGRSRLTLAAAAGVLLVCVSGLNLIQAESSSDDTGDGAETQEKARTSDDWPAWTPERIRQATSQGRPVLVVFSAEWCITCKVNERVVLRSQAVTAAFETAGVVVLKADWTERDDTIRAELERHGRAGVPLYLVYDPSSPGRPRVLPELLSQSVVLESIRDASGLASL